MGIAPLGETDHGVGTVLVGDEVLVVDAAVVGIGQGEGSYPAHQIAVVGHGKVAGDPWVVVRVSWDAVGDMVVLEVADHIAAVVLEEVGGQGIVADQGEAALAPSEMEYRNLFCFELLISTHSRRQRLTNLVTVVIKGKRVNRGAGYGVELLC